jgi:Ca-activated chloride channel family protein
VIRLAARTGFVVLLAGVLASSGAAQQQSKGPYASQRGEGQAGNGVEFRSKDGKKKGWKVVIPGNRPLATPAVVEGKVFIGGGFGSHEFYAFDAATGARLWVYRTKDDGPTAAAVADGYVAFNTESCELVVLTVEGKPVWNKWLGDPLMSMPAIADGKVFMAYPNSKGDRKHYLACFELKNNGKELWKHEIAGEIITAPVIDKDRVFLATLDGTLYCFGQDGKLAWQEKRNATSAPVILDEECYFSCREQTTVKKDNKDVAQQHEALARRGGKAKDPVKEIEATRRTADYLDPDKRAKSSVEFRNQLMDANVGFIGASRGDSKIGQAMNLGQKSVAGVWSYQGSRPQVAGERLYSAMGDTLKCVDLKSEKVLWKIDPREMKDKGELLDAVLTPPALVNGKLFLGTASGEVLCLSADTGKKLWSANVGEPIVFQPAVAKGRVYVATSAGSLICLETGDDKDDGWAMWGANASHNGTTGGIPAKK